MLVETGNDEAPSVGFKAGCKHCGSTLAAWYTYHASSGLRVLRLDVEFVRLKMPFSHHSAFCPAWRDWLPPRPCASRQEEVHTYLYHAEYRFLASIHLDLQSTQDNGPHTLHFGLKATVLSTLGRRTDQGRSSPALFRTGAPPPIQRCCCGFTC